MVICFAASVSAALGISYKRLASQCIVKRANFGELTHTLTKKEVVPKRLSDFVVVPTGCDMSFISWWKSKGNSDEVCVQYPHHRHGQQGKP